MEQNTEMKIINAREAIRGCRYYIPKTTKVVKVLKLENKRVILQMETSNNEVIMNEDYLLQEIAGENYEVKKPEVKEDITLIYASKAMQGVTYMTARSKLLIKILEFKEGKVKVESLETGNEMEIPDTYLLKTISQEEVNEKMAKKTEVKKEGKVKKAGKVCIDYAILAPLMASGEPVRVKDILTKIKVEATTCSSYFRVYATLEKEMRRGVLKSLGKGTFQLKGSTKKATEVVKPEPKKKTEPKKVEKPVEKKESKKKTAKVKTEKKVEEKPTPEATKPSEEVL